MRKVRQGRGRAELLHEAGARRARTAGPPSSIFRYVTSGDKGATVPRPPRATKWEAKTCGAIS